MTDDVLDVTIVDDADLDLLSPQPLENVFSPQHNNNNNNNTSLTDVKQRQKPKTDLLDAFSDAIDNDDAELDLLK
jgi:hypothetical protein